VIKYKISKYESNNYNNWNTFIANAKNATFLFNRDFMDYHKDRFTDYSLLITNSSNKIVAVLPANLKDTVLHSHQGLTYGGLVLSKDIILAEVIDIVYELLKYLNKNEINTIYLKLLPDMYNALPSNEIDYILFLIDARLNRRDSLAVLDLNLMPNISRVRKRGIEKGIKNGLIVKEEQDFELFWNEILIPNLNEKYNVNPVHTLEEIRYLKTKFPDKIKQYNVYNNTTIVAGVTVFEKNNVVHPQYISGKKEYNNNLGSLDFLYNYLIFEVYKDKKYFDFGISNENDGTKLNQSLHYWKESFGARTFKQDFYIIETCNYTLLENVLI